MLHSDHCKEILRDKKDCAILIFVGGISKV
jgi:hypothetical protein